MATVYLSLGTNLGDKEKNLSEAIQRIEKQAGNILSRSAFYMTEPWGFISMNSFLNAAIELKTELCPHSLLKVTQEIEKEMGREAKSIQGIYNDRIIDIDILLYDDLICSNTELTIPHPLMTKRKFVMKPLAEIAPDVIHPVLHKNFSKILQQIQA
ncbi:MAG: 2-amino-4-hydroxy-6-hydroxymethyldihydropteridine diphosphokinase [Tannerellaceae bacterium]|nr:2-amino-4-hydroxy-6-hydroxymethyldihydropteridine diphosphokinase [Tannerellaceae bacterium]